MQLIRLPGRVVRLQTDLLGRAVVLLAASTRTLHVLAITFPKNAARHAACPMARSVFARMILLAAQLDHLGDHYLREHHPHPAPEILPKDPARLAYARLPKQLNQTTLIHDDGLLSQARFTLRTFRDSYARRLSPNGRPSSVFNNQWNTSGHRRVGYGTWICLGFFRLLLSHRTDPP